LHGLRKFVQNVQRLVQPAALMARRWESLVERFPEPSRRSHWFPSSQRLIPEARNLNAAEIRFRLRELYLSAVSQDDFVNVWPSG
jgi:hypothetical protein